MTDRPRLRDTGPDDTQPDGLAAFLAGAGYHVSHVGEIPHDASESLIAMGCYYGPRLRAAVEAVLELTRDVQGDLPGECDVSVGQVREAISRELLKGNQDAV